MNTSSVVRGSRPAVMSAGGAAGGGVAVEVGLALAGADLKTACVIAVSLRTASGRRSGGEAPSGREVLRRRVETLGASR